MPTGELLSPLIPTPSRPRCRLPAPRCRSRCPRLRFWLESAAVFFFSACSVCARGKGVWIVSARLDLRLGRGKVQGSDYGWWRQSLAGCCGSVFAWFRGGFARERRVWFSIAESSLAEALHSALGSLAAFAFSAFADACTVSFGSYPESDQLSYRERVSVKWQKEVFPGIEIDTTQPPLVFKSQLYTLTGVPPERQKIMVKGGILKDDADWSTLGVKDGQKLMMIGTADEIVKAPEKGPVFVEDLPEEEQVVALGHSAGLYNLGNTCYMNSTLQCLHSVPELKSALLSYSDTLRGNGIDQASHNLTLATRNTFGELDQSVRPVAPLQFLQTLRKKYPQFAQQHNNVYMQQDAEECWTQLVYTLSQTLTSDSSESAALPMKQLFGIDLVSRVHCAESGEESVETESVYSLKCHISQDVNHLHEGLKHGLKTELEKASPALGRTAIYTRESRINELPRYLTVQFVRFFWKRESNQKAKILRKVDYPLELDVYEFCSDELKQKLQAPRQMLRDAENAKFGLKAQGKASSSKENEGSSSSAGESSSMDIDKAVSSLPKKQLTGVYDLVAVLTHKGRSADSGHYVGWVKQDDGKWIEFDDDNPNIRKEEDILKLSGGGDWHMAYICLYKARMAESKS